MHPPFIMNEKLLLIDADSLMYYEMGKPSLEQAIAGINDRIETMLQETGAEKYAGFLTLRRCFRYNIDTSYVYEKTPYKHNRKGGSKPIIFYALKEYLQQDPHNFVGLNGLEADDAVGIYSEIAKKEGYEPIICSPDKDVLQQLPGRHLNYQKLEFVVTSEEEAEKFLWKQTLMGDSTDGIPGIRGLGPKTAEKLLMDCNDPHKVAIEAYLKEYGIREGVTRFAETFNLVYILRTEEAGSRITSLPNLSSILTSKPTLDATSADDLFSAEWT